MKRGISVAFLLLLCTNIFAQQWAPIGAQWHYGRWNLSDPRYMVLDYYLLESIGDTVILGINCRKLEYKISLSHNPSTPETIFTYQSNDSVYMYHEDSIPNFQMHYSWGANVNDSWKIKYSSWWHKDSSITVTVDSISNIVVNGFTLRRQFVSYINPSGSNEIAVYTESMGDPRGFFGTEGPNPVLDGNLHNGLRCYSDTIIGLYGDSSIAACEEVIILSVENHEDENKIEIYPNPTSDFIFVDAQHSLEDFIIYNSVGKIVLSGKLKEDQKIEVLQLNNGLFFLELKGDNRSNYRYRFIKN